MLWTGVAPVVTVGEATNHVNVLHIMMIAMRVVLKVTGKGAAGSPEESADNTPATARATTARAREVSPTHHKTNTINKNHTKTKRNGAGLAYML